MPDSSPDRSSGADDGTPSASGQGRGGAGATLCHGGERRGAGQLRRSGMDITKRSVASLALGLAGIVIAGIGLDRLLETGSCASGGPYATLRDCPDGIE